MNRRPPEWQPFVRCIDCGCRVIDHQPIRYVLRARLLHYLPARIRRVLRPLRR
jgi:hypothetical protein